ncbi:MAG: sugar transferase [Bacteroidales bacterium]|nr:sugar transferase [Bacteroidales bacterium]
MGKKRYPYQYEEVVSQHGYTEPGSDGSAHLDVEGLENADLKRLMVETGEMKVPQTLEWIALHRGEFDSGSVVYEGTDGEEVAALFGSGSGSGGDGDGAEEGEGNGNRGGADAGCGKVSLMVLTAGLNSVKDLNVLLGRSSEALSVGGYLWVHTNTSGIRKASIFRANPPVIRNVIYFFWYLWYRVMPKLRLTRWMCRLWEKINGKVNRCYHRVEVLGRLYRAGFEVVDERFRNGHFYVVGRKVKDPIWEDEPTGSPIIKLHRVGKDGKLIPVFKFRTMHSYSEYLQGYVYKYNSLDKDGKFANDYRIAGYGKVLRNLWLDELPMVINLFRGDVKLVGVRPISRQFYSLYSPEMQQLRIKVKPGIFPPSLSEKKRPEGIIEVQEGEKRYIEAYMQHPFKTDWRVFWTSVGHIVFKGERSK